MAVGDGFYGNEFIGLKWKCRMLPVQRVTSFFIPAGLTLQLPEMVHLGIRM